MIALFFGCATSIPPKRRSARKWSQSGKEAIREDSGEMDTTGAATISGETISPCGPASKEKPKRPNPTVTLLSGWTG